MRRIPAAIEDKVKVELELALSQEIIEPVYGPSDRISQIVIAFKGDGNIRLCIDMLQANKAIQRENYQLSTFESFLTNLKDAKYFSRLDFKSAYQ